MKMSKRKKRKLIIALFILALSVFAGIKGENNKPLFEPVKDGMPEIVTNVTSEIINEVSNSLGTILDISETIGIQYENENVAYEIINNNVPYFIEDEITTEVFELYSELDGLGRCGVAYANICKELMPTEPRGEIGMIKPTGWHTVKYNDLIDGNYLYNRCHLIGFQLAGENANEKNLITGTRFLNVEGMLPFENQIANYVKSTDNHVLYRVTPIFDGDNLVASGVLMEAYSVEDDGTGVQFCVYCPNVQPGIVIDYKTGDSKRYEE